MEIKVGDIVFHQLSKLLFKCENKKHEKWMNENRNYKKTSLSKIDYDEYEKEEKNRCLDFISQQAQELNMGY